MAAVMTAEKRNGESIKESMRKEPLINSSGRHHKSSIRFNSNGFLIHEPSTNSKFDTAFHYSSHWYSSEIIAQFTGTSEHLSEGRVLMFDAFVNLTRRLLPSCGANDLVCISRTHSDVDDSSNQNEPTAKKIIYLKTSDVIFIKISETINGSVKMKLKRVFFDNSYVLNCLSDFFKFEKMGIEYLEGTGAWFVADPSKRNLAFAMGSHKSLGESSLVRLLEEGIVKDISRMSLTGSFDPWKAYDEALDSEFHNSLDVFKIVLEYTRAIWGGLRDTPAYQENPLLYKLTMKSIEKPLQKINEYLSTKHATERDTLPEKKRSQERSRKKSRFQMQVESSPKPDEEGQPGSSVTPGALCCMNCGLRIMPNTYCIPHAYTSSPVPEVHPRHRAQHDAVEDLMQRVSLS